MYISAFASAYDSTESVGKPIATVKFHGAIVSVPGLLECGWWLSPMCSAAWLDSPVRFPQLSVIGSIGTVSPSAVSTTRPDPSRYSRS